MAEETMERYPRFELSADENVCLIASFVVAGRWLEINMDEPQAMTWLFHFLGSLRGDSAEAVKDIYVLMQNILMAHHKTDFLGIQLQPPFSDWGRSNAERLAAALRQRGEPGFKAEWKQVFHDHWFETQPEQIIVTYEGGPGDSTVDAIVMHAPDQQISVHSQYWYLFYHYGRGWQLGRQIKEQAYPGNKFYDRLEVVMDDGERHSLYFDCTERVLHSLKLAE